MDFLTEISLSQIQYYLQQYSGAVGVCCNQAIPKSILQKSNIDNFYYYQNQAVSQSFSEDFIQGELNNLPFLTDSIDVFVLWHNLDFQLNPHEVIRECWRALAPNGVLLLLGTNHPSFFSAKKIKSDHKILNKPVVLQRYLLQVGFDVEEFKTYGFRPRIKQAKLFQWLKPLEVIGQFCFPMFGSNYLIQARKPVLGATPIRNNQTQKRVLAPRGLAAHSRNL